MGSAVSDGAKGSSKTSVLVRWTAPVRLTELSVQWPGEEKTGAEDGWQDGCSLETL